MSPRGAAPPQKSSSLNSLGAVGSRRAFAAPSAGSKRGVVPPLPTLTSCATEPFSLPAPVRLTTPVQTFQGIAADARRATSQGTLVREKVPMVARQLSCSREQVPIITLEQVPCVARQVSARSAAFESSPRFVIATSNDVSPPPVKSSSATTAFETASQKLEEAEAEIVSARFHPGLCVRSKVDCSHRHMKVGDLGKAISLHGTTAMVEFQGEIGEAPMRVTSSCKDLEIVERKDSHAEQMQLFTKAANGQLPDDTGGNSLLSTMSEATVSNTQSPTILSPPAAVQPTTNASSMQSRIVRSLPGAMEANTTASNTQKSIVRSPPAKPAAVEAIKAASNIQTSQASTVRSPPAAVEAGSALSPPAAVEAEPGFFSAKLVDWSSNNEVNTSQVGVNEEKAAAPARAVVSKPAQAEANQFIRQLSAGARVRSRVADADSFERPLQVGDLGNVLSVSGGMALVEFEGEIGEVPITVRVQEEELDVIKRRDSLSDQMALFEDHAKEILGDAYRPFTPQCSPDQPPAAEQPVYRAPSTASMGQASQPTTEGKTTAATRSPPLDKRPSVYSRIEEYITTPTTSPSKAVVEAKPVKSFSVGDRVKSQIAHTGLPIRPLKVGDQGNVVAVAGEGAIVEVEFKGGRGEAAMKVTLDYTELEMMPQGSDAAETISTVESSAPVRSRDACIEEYIASPTAFSTTSAGEAKQAEPLKSFSVGDRVKSRIAHTGLPIRPLKVGDQGNVISVAGEGAIVEVEFLGGRGEADMRVTLDYKELEIDDSGGKVPVRLTRETRMEEYIQSPTAALTETSAAEAKPLNP